MLELTNFIKAYLLTRSFIIQISITLLCSFVAYKMFKDSTFNTVWTFNSILSILGSFLGGEHGFIAIIIGGILDALITTALESFAYERSHSFWSFILWQLIIGLAIIGILALVFALIVFIARLAY